MCFLIAGAAIFAVGTFFGASLYAAGQQTRSSRTSQKFQDAIMKNLEKATDGPKNH